MVWEGAGGCGPLHCGVAKKPVRKAVETSPPADRKAIAVARPIALASVVGQERARAVLTDTMRSGRVHHAWIFHGPAGVGKFTTALAFAANLLDPSLAPNLSGELEPDPSSPVQRLLAAGSHPDLVVITKELAKFHDEARIRNAKQTTIPVDVIRDFLVRPATLGPALPASEAGGESLIGKVFIIDEAELMNAQGQNALLKVLEEPPARVAIILVTESEEGLLPTIRSRCQRVFFPVMTDGDMQAWLAQMAARGDEAAAHVAGLAIEERDWLVNFAEGSPGVFVAADQGGLYGWWRALEPMLIGVEQGRYSVDMGPTMARLVEEWAAAWVKRNDLASKEAANKAAAGWMFRMLAGHFRRRLRIVAGRQAPSGPLEPLLACLDAIRAAESEIDANVQGQFAFEKLSCECAAAFSTLAAGR